MTACARCGCPVEQFVPDPTDNRCVCPCVVSYRDMLRTERNVWRWYDKWLKRMKQRTLIEV